MSPQIAAPLEQDPHQRRRCSSASTALCEGRGQARAVTPSRSACLSAITSPSAAPARGSTTPPRSASPKSSNGSPRWAPPSARTCWPTSRPSHWRCDERGGPRRLTRVHARGHEIRRGRNAASTATWSRCRVRASSRSCNSRSARFAGKSLSRLSSCAATTAAPTDNKAIIAETVRLRAERARLLGFADFAHYRLDDAMAKTPEAVRDLLDTVWAPARAARARRSRRPAGADRRRKAATSSSRRGTGATTRKSCGKARCDFDEAAIKPYLSSRPHDRGGVLHGASGCSA